MRVLVGTDSGLLAVDDDGTTRVELDAPTRRVRLDGGRDAWALLADGAVAHRTGPGRWDVAPTGVDADATAMAPAGGAALVGTRDGRLWRVLDGDPGPLSGFDAVDGRDTWHAVGSRVPYVRSVAVTADDAAWLASVHVGGIPRSTDAGRSWRPTVDVDDDVHEVRAHPTDPVVVRAAAAVGLLESSDGGATWSAPVAGGLHSSYLRALAFTDGATLVSASDGPFGHRVALYRRDDGGGGFERCREGLPDWLPAIVDTAQLDARGPAVAAGSGHSVFRSDDAGRSWRRLDVTVAGLGAVALDEGP